MGKHTVRIELDETGHHLGNDGGVWIDDYQVPLVEGVAFRAQVGEVTRVSIHLIGVKVETKIKALEVKINER